VDPKALLLLIMAAVAIGIVATIYILRHQRIARDRARASIFATATEGEKRCPSCGMFNSVTSRNCVSCKRLLPG
jgi:hypothetical protein